MPFYGVVGIIHEGAYFLGFIAFEKLKYYARFKVYAIKLKTKNFHYFSKSRFQILVFDKRQVKAKVKEKIPKSLEEIVKERRGTRSELL